MSDNSDTLHQIADDVGEVTEEQQDEHANDMPAREGDEFDPEDMSRNKADYDGGW